MRTMTEKKRGRLGYYPDGSTYIVEIPFDHPDTTDRKPYLGYGMTAEEIRVYNPWMSEEEVAEHAARLAVEPRAS